MADEVKAPAVTAPEATKSPERAALEAKLYPNVGNTTFHDAGGDNASVGNNDGMAKDADGSQYNPNSSTFASSRREELKRCIDTLTGKVDNNHPALGDTTLFIAENGRVAVGISKDLGGLDSRGKATSQGDLSPAMARQLSGRVDNVKIKGSYSLGSQLSIRADIPEEEKQKYLERLYALEKQMVEKFGGAVPIYRAEYDPKNQITVTNPDGTTRFVTKKEELDFAAELRDIREHIFTEPSAQQRAELLKVVNDVNAGKRPISDIEPLLSTVFEPELLKQQTTLANTTLPEKMAKGDSSIVAPAQGAAYAKYDPNRPMTKESAHQRMTYGMDGRRANESDEDYKRREQDWMAEMLTRLPPEQAMIMFLLLAAAAYFSGDKETFNNLMTNAGTGGHHYNSTTRDYDNAGRVFPSKDGKDTVGTYSQTVDPAQYANSDKTLKAGSISQIRDNLKVEYSSRIDPYLYKGNVADIPKDKPVIVLDLGHLGMGSDLGSGKMVNGEYLCEPGACMEANIAMAKKFHDQGFTVVSTSQSERFESNTLSPGARQGFTTQFVNIVGKDKVFFLSSHFNEAGSASVSGLSTFVDQQNGDSVTYANEIQGALVKSGHYKQFGTGVIDEHDSQHAAGLSVTTNSYPSVLVELGFRDGDQGKLSNKQAMAAVGDTIATAVTTIGVKEHGWQVAIQEKPVQEKPAEEKKAEEPAKAADDKPALPVPPVPGEKKAEAGEVKTSSVDSTKQVPEGLKDALQQFEKAKAEPASPDASAIAASSLPKKAVEAAASAVKTSAASLAC